MVPPRYSVLRTPFLPEPIVGIQALKDLIANLRVTFPDFKGTIEEVVVKGDQIWSRYTMTGTNAGPLGELPPTGKKMHVTGMAITRVVDGKVVEDQTYWNVLGFFSSSASRLCHRRLRRRNSRVGAEFISDHIRANARFAPAR